jgi:aldehyde:ferredoxin oxidoreductase
LETSPEELARCGERAWNLHRAWSVRDGFTREDDRFPDKWFEPLTAPDGSELRLRHYFGQPIDPAGAEALLDDYYDERGWDREAGIPTREKLLELRLGTVAADLEERGVLLR